jgi:hypothetical protein
MDYSIKIKNKITGNHSIHLSRIIILLFYFPFKLNKKYLDFSKNNFDYKKSLIDIKERTISATTENE